MSNEAIIIRELLISRFSVFSVSSCSFVSLRRMNRAVLQCKRPCSAARAKRAVRGGCGPVSGVWRLGLTGLFLSCLAVGRLLSVVVGVGSLGLFAGTALLLHGFGCFIRFDQGLGLAANHVQRCPFMAV